MSKKPLALQVRLQEIFLAGRKLPGLDGLLEIPRLFRSLDTRCTVNSTFLGRKLESGDLS